MAKDFKVIRTVTKEYNEYKSYLKREPNKRELRFFIDSFIKEKNTPFGKGYVIMLKRPGSKYIRKRPIKLIDYHLINHNVTSNTQYVCINKLSKTIYPEFFLSPVDAKAYGKKIALKDKTDVLIKRIKIAHGKEPDYEVKYEASSGSPGQYILFGNIFTSIIV